MRTLKRVLVWVLEVLAEALLLGTLLGVLLFPNIVHLIPGLWALGLAVGVVLFLHGYYLTRALVGVAWRSRRPWLYPAIAASLFVAHMHFAVIRLKPDMTPVARGTEPPFLAGGACIVFACAFAGNWLLRKWTHTSSNGPSPQHRGIVPGSAGV